ncbi:MAG: hypothetical protein CMJ18_03625 [Phycisphaeraceae bacterium]|nr:hypothetical protein [Phycisphaeraceae bacterium]
MKHRTWADFHVEVAQNHRRRHLSWPSRQVLTDLAFCHQPTIVRSTVTGELYSHGAEGRNDRPCALVWHSTDRGRSWSQLCRSPLLAPPMPPGARRSFCTYDGIGTTDRDTLLVSCRRHWDGRANGVDAVWQSDPTSRDQAWVIRSGDRGQTWERSAELDSGDYLNVGSDVARFCLLENGKLLLAQCAMPWSHTDDRRPDPPWRGEAYLFESRDDGRTWQRIGTMGLDTCECDLLELPSKRILATTRYQRKRIDGDPPDMVSNEWLEVMEGLHPGFPTEPEGYCFYKQTAVLHSDDGGRTWSTPRLVTGWLQQTACLVRLSDGTIVLPFSHKNDGHGQRFIISYDEGETWSNSIFELNGFGLYASSVALDDDTIVTVTETPRWHKPVQFHVLRWSVPPRKAVEEQGFFTPRPVS